MRSAEERHELLVAKTTGYEHKNDENEVEKEKEMEKEMDKGKGKKKQGFDKDLVLKKMEKFLKSVQSEKDENKETETSPYFRHNDRPHRNLSKSDRSDTKQSSNVSRSLSSKKRDKSRRERSRSKSKSRSKLRSASRERRHHKMRERSDDSSRIHYRIRANQKVREERKENENEKDKLKKNYDRIDRYEENDQHERHHERHYDRRKRYEHRHGKESSQNSQKRQENDRRSQRMDGKKTSSCSSDRFENDKYTYKERKRYHEDCSPRDRKKESERRNHGSEPKYRNNSKYVYNKYTGEKIETKFFHVPLGFHVTKENWRAYTKWLKRKNKYRFDIPFDQHEIYRRSSSLSPNAWEEFVKDSEENETEEEKLEKDTTRKGRHKEEKKKERERDKEDGDIEGKEKHKKERKKIKRRDREDEDAYEDEDTTRKEKREKERKKRKKENSEEEEEEEEEEEDTSSSSESFDSFDSTTETKKRKKREQIKKRKKKKHDHKKKVSKEKKGKRERGRKRRKRREGRERRESKKRKTIKEKNKRKEDTEQNPLDSDKESISSSLTSVSFLNEEMELEDEVLVQGKALKEDKTKYTREKNTDVKGANKENVRIEHEEKEEHFSKRKERSLVKEPNELNQRETVKNDLKEKQEQMSDNESDIGPMPLDINVKLANKPINYGVAMMPGEGEAIAQFVQKGKRIPRRGEVGLSAEAIENYEKLGYVMSGSRHKRMNAIRMRKENQVYSVEEQRALAMYNYEERAMRENALINDLREILRKQNEAIMHETQNENE